MAGIPTLEDVARRAGVSPSTASAALRASPVVRPDTAARVLQAADALGYQRNTAASVMASSRGRSGAKLLSIACLTLVEGASGERQGRNWAGQVLNHARRRGFLAEHHNLRSPADAPAIAERLWRRGTDGLILLRMEPLEAPPVLDIPWERFCVVSRQPEHRQQGIDVVRASFRQPMKLMLDALVRHGFRRIGFILTHHDPFNDDDRGRLGTIEVFRQIDGPPESAEIPVLRNVFLKIEKQPIVEWMKRYRPEVVCGFNNLSLEIIEEAGWRVPEDVRYVGLDVGGRQIGRMAGLTSNHEAAVEPLLTALERKVRRFERGISDHAIESIYPLPFRPGGTLPGIREI